MTTCILPHTSPQPAVNDVGGPGGPGNHDTIGKDELELIY